MSTFVLEHGDVWRREHAATPMNSGLKHVCRGSEELAIAFVEDRLLKAGGAESVAAWLDKNRLAIFDGDPVLVRFPVSQETVDEMNACVANSSRVRMLLDNLARMAETHPELNVIPKYPK